MSDDRRRFLRAPATRGGDFHIPGGLLKKAVQQGRGERRVESYFVPYIEPLSNARTMSLAGRLFKKAAQQGRNERKIESYSVWYVETLSDVRTTLSGLFQQRTW